MLERAKLLVLCYPNSPTGKVATREFYERVIDFAQQNEIVVVQDAAHIMLTYEGEPLSFLSVPGAKDVGVEVHSMSKGFHMIGWRLGWVCGHERIVQAFADVKDNSDSGQFIGHPEGGRRRARRRFAFRGTCGPSTSAACEKLVATLGALRLRLPDARRHVLPLHASAQGHRPAGPKFETAEAASQYLITEHSICTVPWDDAGAFLRFSVTYEAPDEAAEDALMAETEKRLQACRLKFA